MNELLSDDWIGLCVMSVDSSVSVAVNLALLLQGWNWLYFCVMQILKFYIFSCYSWSISSSPISTPILRSMAWQKLCQSWIETFVAPAVDTILYDQEGTQLVLRFFVMIPFGFKSNADRPPVAHLMQQRMRCGTWNNLTALGWTQQLWSEALYTRSFHLVCSVFPVIPQRVCEA